MGKDEMSRAGKLCALVDSFCAMISKRPHAEAMDPKDAAQALVKDTRRYDERLSKMLMVGFTTEELTLISGPAD